MERFRQAPAVFGRPIPVLTRFLFPSSTAVFLPYQLKVKITIDRHIKMWQYIVGLKNRQHNILCQSG